LMLRSILRSQGLRFAKKSFLQLVGSDSPIVQFLKSTSQFSQRRACSRWPRSLRAWTSRTKRRLRRWRL
jgi:hypothetical protein